MTGCINPRHDHVAYDEANEAPAPGAPMECSDCDAGLHYDLDLEDYRHDDPAVSCFLVPAGVDQGSRCTTVLDDEHARLLGVDR